ncbi:MAG: putative zinc-binding protein [Thermoguttaceae bacterium]
MAQGSKVGIISCSGEEIAEGTVARQAVRRVLEALRPQQTVTLCLPLFLAGEQGERRFASEHPTITVDGCPKLCAKHGTEKHSGKVSASLVVSHILGDQARQCHRSLRDADHADEQAVWLVAEHIAAEVDALAALTGRQEQRDISQPDGACCACSKPSEDGRLEIKGQPVAVAGLPLIFQHLKKKGLHPGGDCGSTLLKTVKIYHSIDADDEADYRDALVLAYRAYCER